MQLGYLSDEMKAYIADRMNKVDNKTSAPLPDFRHAHQENSRRQPEVYLPNKPVNEEFCEPKRDKFKMG